MAREDQGFLFRNRGKEGITSPGKSKGKKTKKKKKKQEGYGNYQSEPEKMCVPNIGGGGGRRGDSYSPRVLKKKGQGVDAKERVQKKTTNEENRERL